MASQKIHRKLFPPFFISFFWSLAFASLVLTGCKDASSSQGAEEVSLQRDTTLGLKDYYQDYFPIGASVGPRSLEGDQAELLRRHFASLTAENVMKMGPIHPEEDEYAWAPADQIAGFAKENGLLLRGHTLCWHNQTPKWLFVDGEGKTVGKEMLLNRLREHINAVAGRYKGQIYAWDVVNEVISDDTTTFYRENSPWYQISGKEYIAKAFEYAHAADPETQLFYNDYNATKPAKRDKIYQMVKELKEAGAPIHGIGIQGHWSIYGPSEAELRAALDLYSSLGLPIQITELDISVYPPESGRRERREDESDEFTPEMERRQVEQYEMIFRVFREYKDVITGVTFWNVSDRHSWLDNFPVRGRKNYPLLFDQDLKPKKAYWAAVDF
jgi:endo-1,4-beta-xylanase